MLKGKKVLIGITGSIAAYKVPFLVRLLVKEGAEVRILMTPSACDFVTPLTLSTLSQFPVSIKPFEESTGAWNSHIDMGNWADVFIIAPLSANTMAKMATGITDNLLTAVYLAARCPVFFAPAMDVDMFNHPSTQDNIKRLQTFGNLLIPPAEGELASGLKGFGRMQEPEVIVQVIQEHFKKSTSLSKKKVLITSGPTVEPIDPVRFISNHSSGLMGTSLAIEAASRGAEVTLVSGPVSSYPVHPRIAVVKVVTAAEMHKECVERFADQDITIMAAAVADYTPEKVANQKIKKKGDNLVLQLVQTKDILASLSKLKSPSRMLIGFALETENEMENALKKLHTKNLDLIVLNSLNDAGAGFGKHTNKVTLINKNGEVKEIDTKPKTEVAAEIWNEVVRLIED